ncbi:MAG: hypothetical protein K0U66_01460 [Gammaproteobacteria bacterium]|nr:hypothetical protein [Gammaproteobacteria bacterium]
MSTPTLNEMKILEKLFRGKVFARCTENPIVLKDNTTYYDESGNQKRKPKTIISGLNDQIFFFKLENVHKNFNKLMSLVFNCESSGVCRCADYIIISTADKCIIYIELKQKRHMIDVEKEIEEQLTGAKCFLKYCTSLIENFSDEENFMNEYRHRYVGIIDVNAEKIPTRFLEEDSHPESDPHDSPENFFVLYNSETLPYKMILTGINHRMDRG